MNALITNEQVTVLKMLSSDPAPTREAQALVSALWIIADALVIGTTWDADILNLVQRTIARIDAIAQDFLAHAC